MNELLIHRRRVLLITYRRFLAADRAWSDASETARALVRKMPKSVAAIGTPRSRMRALHGQRERALQQLHVARFKLEVARRRCVAQTVQGSQSLHLPAH